MKTIIKLFVFSVVVASMALFTACTDESLNVIPKDSITALTLFGDEKSADLNLMDVYTNLPDMEGQGNPDAYFQYDNWENWSDNTVSNFDWATSFVATQERSMGADVYNPGWYNHSYPAIPFIYDRMYQYIRKANFFIENVNINASKFSDNWKKTRLAEARFLRAFYYHELLMAYGGVPIIEKTLNLANDGANVFYPRSTAKQTSNFIISELKAAAADLPNEVSKGRATQAAALTLKAWVELFSKNYAEAANTCSDIMNLKVHGLFPKYNDQFMAANNNNVESIFAYQHDLVNKKTMRSAYYGPIGVYNTSSTADRSGAMQPTQSLVDEYKMKDGLPKELSPLWDPSKPYDNREPRFYASIIYNGAIFAGHTYSSTNLYNVPRGIRTGYFRRKGIDPTMTTTKLGSFIEASNYAYFRYAEVLLMYAEAKIELNQIDNTVIDAIDQVRVRGGIPKLEISYNKSSFGQDELRQILRSERRIEFAFEQKRYWDLIRWRTAEIVLNQPYMGLTVDNAGNYVPVMVKTCSFHPEKNYLFPIYKAWIDINPKMKVQNDGIEFFNGQNPGY
ncbi:MAG: RagB/SusD family nutrient uptake outer membrane protein [Paludibacter sp.]|nr:RagB/SusD family nutrient uptake outer membrane protein [Paludibacter sp.]